MLCLKENLIKIRKRQGLSQEKLAELIGVSRGSISKWETGKKTPNADNIAELAIVLNVSSDYLLGINVEEEVNKVKRSAKIERVLSELIAAG